ncbi:MAG: aspartate/glutamate racemase family protein [Proteobacteria bacterium]|nr:aspartate/glutamate racemase family protein [Pseudomonadota bacterium]
MTEANDRILGVLGGMGPLASAHFMLRLTLLTPATRDQEHIPTVLWSDPRIPDRIAGRAGTGPDPLPWFLRGIDGLRQAGCGAIAVPCNTAHAWHDEMAAGGLPILHIVDAAAADLDTLRLGSRRIGVMGTVPTLQLRLYQDRLSALGWDCIQPTEEEMQRLVLPAIAQVKVNRMAGAYAPLVEAVNNLASRGAAAVVLGCTEIPLGILAGPQEALRVPVVDTIDSLARASIRWARPG